MTKNLLTLLFALQKATLDADQRLSLAQLGNKLEAISGKNHPTEQDWQKVQTQINDILSRNATLAEHYQQFVSQLQTLDAKALQNFLPSAEQLAPIKTKALPTLGYTPAPSSKKDEDVENTVVEIAIIVFKQDDPAAVSRELMPTDKTENSTKK